MENEQSETNWIRRGVVIGILASSILIFSNKKTRTKVTDCVGECTNKTKNFVTYVKDNRQSFLDQMKASGEKISSVIDDASEDIQTIVETSQHLKDHTQTLFKTLQGVKGDFQSLSDTLKAEDKETTLKTKDVLQNSDDELLN